MLRRVEKLVKIELLCGYLSVKAELTLAWCAGVRAGSWKQNSKLKLKPKL